MRYNDKDWRESMRLTVDFNNMMAGYIGGRGIQTSEIDALRPKLAAAVAAMRDKRGAMKWRELPYNQQEIVADIERAAKDIAARFENFVVLGIGGSALGPIAVQQALNPPYYNELLKAQRGGPRFFVEDNADPERMAALLHVIDIEKTMFNVITKSGGTSETMSQLLIVCGLLEARVGTDAIRNHLIATTGNGEGDLMKIAKELGLKTYCVPDGVGGRFSELCPVGLLAAAVCGIDIRALLAGAAYMDACCAKDDIWENPAYMLAALQYAAMQRGCNISVMMPYADGLKYMADWYAQLWAESLGKRYALDGSETFCGQTPVKALGVTDQHSQVQLYTEGPYDKVVTFLDVGAYRARVEIPHGFESIPDVAFLGGHSLNELMAAERIATEYALHKSGRLSHTITLPEVNAFTIGQLLYLFEVQTAFAGELLNINAFDQPGVEEGKNAAYALLGKPGFENKRAKLAAMPARDSRYMI
ncbi:MAG: glucose-6-phosphate isomerase [Clostridiales bacterium]|nr:glucose-6-phosphate isomerase [Clostridiales bacterium]